MKTQIQHAESARRFAANKAEGIAFLLSLDHKPTRAEVLELRKKNPKAWSGYPLPNA